MNYAKFLTRSKKFKNINVGNKLQSNFKCFIILTTYFVLWDQIVLCI